METKYFYFNVYYATFFYIYDRTIYQHRNDINSQLKRKNSDIVVITVERIQNVTFKHDKFFCVKE